MLQGDPEETDRRKGLFRITKKGFKNSFRKKQRRKIMKKLKVGVIGVGRLGYEHACNIANRVPGMELVAICDGNAPRAKEVADELNVEKIYSDPATMCADPEVEAVAIFTNTASHVDMIRIAMEAGKHVFCEKPLAENVEKCLAAEEIIKAHPNQVFMLGFMRRFDKSYRIAKQKIDNGDIGRVVLVPRRSGQSAAASSSRSSRIGMTATTYPA